MIILGISAFYHDSAVAFLKDGEIIYAAQEERFTRKKHDSAFPLEALKKGYEICSISPEDVDYVVFYEKPLLKFDRLMSTYLQFAPRGILSFIPAMYMWFKEKLFIKQIIQDHTKKKEIFFIRHHESHAASAFYPSPFSEAAIITIDGVGEWDTLTIGKGMGNEIELLKSLSFPHSLGLLYSAFTYFAGFKVNSGEYKLMGLAPYGKPKYVGLILDNLIDVKKDGSFRINLDYFDYHIGLKMINHKFNRLFGAKPRKSELPLRQLDMDLAASIQWVLEDIMEKLVMTARGKIESDNLCLAGGVALNCVANGKILKKQIFKKIWIQPASGDAGGALGAALFVWYKYFKNKREPDIYRDFQKGSFLGPSFSSEKIKQFLDFNQIEYKEIVSDKIPDCIANLIIEHKVVGIFQGKMEFGPRALGHRSIIADARSDKMQKILNVKIKFRESFRPFAPSIMAEKLSDYFDFDDQSPYMLLVYNIRNDKRYPLSAESENKIGLQKLDVIRSDVPAVTHVDFSARIHSVNHEENPFFYNIINAFYKKTGCPIIINTSFNVRGEPIVNTPQDAYNCFKNTDMDFLLVENFLIEKKELERKNIDYNWISKFPLD